MLKILWVASVGYETVVTEEKLKGKPDGTRNPRLQVHFLNVRLAKHMSVDCDASASVVL